MRSISVGSSAPILHSAASAAAAAPQIPNTTSAPSAVHKATEAFVADLPWKWTLIGWFGAVHILTLVALPFASWQNVGIALVLWFISGCLGITMGFHRLLSHRSFKTSRPMTWFLALCGSLAFQGGSLEWVARHRMHHSFTDTDDDPHNARRGFWYSHFMWLFAAQEKFDSPARHKAFARDIYRDPFLRYLSSSWSLGFLQFFLLVGLAFVFGWDAALWGVFVRICFGYHCTWLVNSATHKWGYRTFETNEDSRNCWWVAILSFGEGWHNNHHAQHRVCRAGRKFWEFDITYVLIRALAAVGLVWDVVEPDSQESLAE
jgi:stearoyl-CoA desaturase (delta-9 desaturase)